MATRTLYPPNETEAMLARLNVHLSEARSLDVATASRSDLDRFHDRVERKHDIPTRAEILKRYLPQTSNCVNGTY
jgi:hypothetical protein